MVTRDSLELASLASSDESAAQESSSGNPPSSRKISFDNDDPLSQPASTNHIRHSSRSYSVSSAFNFVPSAFPLSSTNGYTSLGGASSLDPSVINGAGSLERQKSLTFLNGLSLVVGLVIGSGIFSSPSQVNVNVGSPGASLIVWLVAGLLAWTGASSYCELGGAIPLNGGAQMYLTKIFGPLIGFLYAWCTICVLKPGSTAIIAIIFGEYVVGAVAGEHANEVSHWITKGAAILGLAAVTLLNAISTKLATRVADLLMFFKFVALLSVFAIGIFVAITGFAWDSEPSKDWKTRNWFHGTSTDLSSLAVALYAGLWAYDGWDNVNYVTGELTRPARDLPRIIHTAVPAVIICYIMANIAYFLCLPLSVTFTSTTVATDVGRLILGGVGSLIMSIIVACSCLGALNATTFTAGRLYYAAAKEAYLPRVFGTLGFRSNTATAGIGSSSGLQQTFGTTFFNTPVAALALNFVLTAVYVFVGTFATLLTFYGVAGYTFYFLTVLGLLVLRVREPHLERPYRCWITTPIIFCCVSLFLLSRSVVAAPWTSLAVVPFAVFGTVIYYWKVRPEYDNKEGNDVGWRFWKRWGRW